MVKYIIIHSDSKLLSSIQEGGWIKVCDIIERCLRYIFKLKIQLETVFGIGFHFFEKKCLGKINWTITHKNINNWCPWVVGLWIIFSYL